MQIKILIYTAFLILCSCSHNEYEQRAWKIAENSDTNKEELIHFLEYYKKISDKEKYEAACFLVSNMTGKHSTGKNLIYDIDVVIADSLIRSLEESFLLKNKSPFLKSYSFKQFLEYILPYRIADEPLEYYWKWDCKHHYIFENTNDIIEAAKQINAQVKLELSPENYGDFPHSYSFLMHNGYGKCNDRSTLLVMALRAAGIPSAYEFVPYWGSSNNGHSFVSIILPDGKIYPLQNTDKITNDSYLSRKTPKIYRKMYGLQTLKEQAADIPELFKDNDLVDVTELHGIQSRDIQITTNETQNTNVYYLSVFSPNGWIPIASSTSVKFSYVGTGKKTEKESDKEAIKLGNGIVYLPVRWENGEAIPIGSPMIISEHGNKEINADIEHCEKVVLKRKYPLNMHIVDFAKLMIMGAFEGANQADFSDAEEIGKITETPESQMQKIDINTNKVYRYIRYRRPNGTFSIAEFCLYSPDGKLLPCRPTACEAIMEDSTMMNVFDKKSVTYYQVNGGIDMWIGADLYKPMKIAAIGFAPRNDDNAIVPEEEYELFYWQDKWHSLGRQKSESDSLIYEKVPKNALLWLRNLSKGREERPFTYESGTQIWW